MTADASRLSSARITVTIAVIVGVISLFVTLGADADWLAALGHIIATRGAVPAGIPFATAPTAHWPDTLVLAELIFNTLQQAFGDDGLLVAQLVATALGLAVLARDARAGGAGSSAIAGALLLVGVGAFPSLAVTRVQLFSLVLFPVLVALLRADSRRPSWRIWLVLPLLALWSNLHGAALSGLAVLYMYLVFSRFRADRRTAVAVAICALVAMCLTPAGLQTVAYYRGLVFNLAAERGVGQWAPLGHSPFDWVLILAAVALFLRLRSRRAQLWELLVLIMLGVLTIKAARSGVWLLFFLVAPSATASRPGGREWNGLVPVGGVVALVLLVAGAGHWQIADQSADAAARRAIELAHGTPVLADGRLAEEVAVEGGRIWAGNPLDAFSRRVQAEYLDWLSGGRTGRAALDNPRVRVVLAAAGSAAARLTQEDPSFVRVSTQGPTALYVRGGGVVAAG